MIDSDKILSEENPYLREVWSMGYSHVFTDEPTGKIRLFNPISKIEKEINIADLQTVMFQCRIRKGIMPNGNVHMWISESGDGLKNFINLIDPKRWKIG